TPVVGALTTIGVLTIQGRFPLNPPAPPPYLRIPGTPGNANPFSGSGVLPPPAAFKVISDASMNISVQCPSDWTAGPADQSTDPIEFPITQPGHLIRMYIARFSSSLSSQISLSGGPSGGPSAGPGQLNDDLISQMSHQFSGVTIPTNASPTI